MATLSRVKSAALAEPEAFVRDLTTGRVRVEGERLLIGGVGAEEQGDKSSSSSSSDGDSDSDSDSESGGENDSEAMKHYKNDAPVNTQPRPQGHAGDTYTSNPIVHPGAATSGPLPWTSIPKPQNVVRCPPINWSQYAVVGESLDKLHDEQVRYPAQGTPAVLTPEGRFEFKGGDGGVGVGKQERYVGVAAPFAPGKDKIDRKSKIPPKR